MLPDELKGYIQAIIDKDRKTERENVNACTTINADDEDESDTVNAPL